ncbi:hypothetical protein SASPL_147179 [Salvia splendens]|uniref:Myb/SANT-like domain-containing protein n=1 Tax=Salvia splendens TaxID=180675 RepID=A0A8X8WDZ9_SALSN|nr:hypothetical protein SASPL_147179 [Salvia splendens]
MYNLIDMASQHIEGSDDDGIPEGNSLLGSKDLAPNRNAKSDRSRRIWSAREEDILMTTLKELAANGWKSDNGFRNGYLVRAREAIKNEFPKTDILPNPHINSKITTWKRNYGSLKMMLNYNGIGFNSDGTYRIECDDEQWALFYWKDVFGNDRADGEKRIDVGAAAGTIYGNKDEAPAADETSTHMSLQDLFPDMIFPEGVLPEMIDESQSATEGGGPGSAVDVGVGAGGEAVGGTGTTIGAASGSGSMGGKKVSKKVLKKQKVEDKMDGVITLMGQIHTDTNERLKEISNRIGYEFDLSNKRSEVFDQLKGIPRLSLKLQFYISKKLVKEPELLDLFRGLPETARAAFVFDLLEADEKLARPQANRNEQGVVPTNPPLLIGSNHAKDGEGGPPFEPTRVTRAGVQPIRIVGAQLSHPFIMGKAEGTRQKEIQVTTGSHPRPGLEDGATKIQPRVI